MSTPTSNRSLVAQHLCAAKKELQDIPSDPGAANVLSSAELEVLYQRALDITSSIGFKRNMQVPINRLLPLEILTLIPYFFESERGRIAITLSHVCQAWRKMFVECASLWTDFRCVDAEKTRVYLERSQSSPVSLWLERREGLSPNDLFPEILPRVFARIKSLTVKTMPDHLQDIVERFAHLPPLLESLTLSAGAPYSRKNAVLETSTFGGDLSPLHELHLSSICTELPWRDMKNLTSFSLSYVRQTTVTADQFLDFFGSAPRLRRIKLDSSSPTAHARSGRLVSLAHLTMLSISGPKPPSFLLDHLVIPVGAEVLTSVDPPGPQINDFLPRSFENLKNLASFTEITLQSEQRGLYYISMEFTGPNGRFHFSSSSRTPYAPHCMPQALAQFDASGTQRLEIFNSALTASEFPEVISSMTNLRALVVSRCAGFTSLLNTLTPVVATDHSIIPCPRLEDLILHHTYEQLDMDAVVLLAELRALMGIPLRSVKIQSSKRSILEEGVVELKKYVPHVEIIPEENLSSVSSGEDSDED